MKMSVPVNSKKNGSIVFVHGINTYASGFHDIKNMLTEEGFDVYLTNFGKFGLLKFLMPFSYFRNKVKAEIYKQLRIIVRDKPNIKFNIVAHSFGSHLVAQILEENFDLKIKRIAFIGSIVRHTFEFEKFDHRYEGKILNEVGLRDVVPVLADGVARGYGSIGTFGFRGAKMWDRFHNTTHSELLNRDYFRDYIIPFFRDGTILTSKFEKRVGDRDAKLAAKLYKPPVWIRFLDLFKARYVLMAIILMLLPLPAARLYFTPSTITSSFSGLEGWSLASYYEGDEVKYSNEKIRIVDYINDQVDAICPLPRSIFGKNCDGFFGQYITQRDWHKIGAYDDELETLSFPSPFVYSLKNPEKFWFQLQELHENCVEVSLINSDLYIQLKKDTENISCDLPRINRE